MLSPAPAPASISAPPARPVVGAGGRFAALTARGRQAARQGALGDAVVFLKEALDLKPSDADTWNTLGVVLVRQGETERGVDAFDHALRLNPKHGDAHRNLAVVLDRQGKSRDAMIHYRSFLSLGAQSDAARDEVRRRLGELAGSTPSTNKPE